MQTKDIKIKCESGGARFPVALVKIVDFFSAIGVECAEFTATIGGEKYTVEIADDKGV